jgi:hypothetical protein
LNLMLQGSSAERLYERGWLHYQPGVVPSVYDQRVENR